MVERYPRTTEIRGSNPVPKSFFKPKRSRMANFRQVESWHFDSIITGISLSWPVLLNRSAMLNRIRSSLTLLLGSFLRQVIVVAGASNIKVIANTLKLWLGQYNRWAIQLLPNVQRHQQIALLSIKNGNKGRLFLEARNSLSTGFCVTCQG